MADRNQVRIEGDQLVVLPRGLDRLWGFRSRIVVPLASIEEVRVEPNPFKIATGWRGPGLDVGNKLVGSFHPRGETNYWNCSGSGGALNIRLDGTQKFNQLYLSVADAQATGQIVSEAIAARSSS